MYFLSPHVPADFTKWNEIWSLNQIFRYSSVGMLSARDSLTINFTPSEAVKRAEEFRSTTADQARHQFDLGQDTRDDLNLPSVVQRVSYRPFDDRFVIYKGRSRGFVGQPARPLARATFGAQNLILVASNRIELGTFRHVFVVITQFHLKRRTTFIRFISTYQERMLSVKTSRPNSEGG
jgi:Type ISP C-terminal specificity domain